MFLIPWLMENCGKNEKKFPNQSGDVMPTSIYFTNYENCCSQVFYRKFLKIPRNTPVAENYTSRVNVTLLV